MLEITDRIVLALASVIPLILALFAGKITVFFAKRRDATGMLPDLLAHIAVEDRPEFRRAAALEEELLDSDEPVFSVGGKELCFVQVRTLATVVLVVLACLGLAFPVLSVLLSIVVAIVLMVARSRGSIGFVDIWTNREAIVTRAYEEAKNTKVLMNLGVAAESSVHKWVQVSEWQGATPIEFIIHTDPGLQVTKALKLNFESNWRKTMAPAGSVEWTFRWRPDERCLYIRLLPKIPSVPFQPLKAHEYKWHEIPLGVRPTGEEVVWNLKNEPHMLIAGLTSMGKSVQLNDIVLHLVQRPDWAIQIADPKDALYTYQQANNVIRFESDLESIQDMVQQYQAENERRKAILKENGKRKWGELGEFITIDGVRVRRPPLLMLIVEEAIDLLAPEGVKEIDALKAEIKGILLKLVATCRSQGLHMIVVIQRPDAAFLGGAFRTNLGARVQVGPMKENDSRMVLFDEAAPMELMAGEDAEGGSVSDDMKGRAVFATSSGAFIPYRGYYSQDDDEPLSKMIRLCNRLTEVDESGAPRITAADLLARVSASRAPAALSQDADGEDGRSSGGVVSRLLGRFGFEMVSESFTEFDDEEDVEVERVRTRLRRVRSGASSSMADDVDDDDDDVAPVRAPRQVSRPDGAGSSGVMSPEEAREARLARARAIRRRAQEERGEEPVVETTAAAPGLPLAVFRDESLAAPVVDAGGDAPVVDDAAVARVVPDVPVVVVEDDAPAAPIVDVVDVAPVTVAAAVVENDAPVASDADTPWWGDPPAPVREAPVAPTAPAEWSALAAPVPQPAPEPEPSTAGATPPADDTYQQAWWN